MRHYLTFIIFIFSISIIVAQDSSQLPTPTANELYTWSSELYFPQQVDFSLLAKRRESEITSLTLTLFYEGVEPMTVEIDPANAEVTGWGTLHTYSWLIPSTSAPPLFSLIRYRWNITTIEGRQLVAGDSFVYQDTRINWETSEINDLPIEIYYPAGALDPNQIRTGILPTYDLLFSRQDEPDTYKLLIYPSAIPIGCEQNEDGQPVINIIIDGEDTVVDCNLTLFNQLINDGNFVLLQQTTEEQIQQLLINQMVESYYLNRWGDITVPQWLLSGLQQFYDPRPDLEALTIAQQNARSGDLLTLNEMVNRPTDNQLLPLWESQSIGFVMYLADTIGVEGLFDFADNLGQAENFESAYENAVGQPLDVLLVAWQDWLFRPSVANDYQYDPYLPDTPTPTITPTSTNTPTPTFTPSITPDVTRTPRPTFTLIPPTPTITPLPAQSFSVQPTAIPPTAIPPEPDQLFYEDDGFIDRAIIGGGMILVLLGLLFVVLRLR